ncbi:hypothetical protein [Longimicrobium sp.]|uniref:hypothetical protein n=1 Tax=Longimicrobium sp. TaxID=2029185 RepID=UPI003B3BE9BB
MRRLAAGLACLALFSACGDGTGLDDERVAAIIKPVTPMFLLDAPIGGVLREITVEVTDSINRPVIGVVVHWRASHGGSATPASSVTGPTGLATTDWTLGLTAGEQILTASVTGLATGQIIAQARPGAPAVIKLSADSLLIGAVGEGQRVGVTMRDVGDNPTSATIHWSDPSGGLVRVERMSTPGDTFMITSRGVGSTELVAEAGSARATMRVRTPAFTFVTTEAERSCGIVATVPYCWGNNTSGALGDGTEVNRPGPVRVSTSAAFSRLAIGRYFACGLTATGAAQCWGANPYGEVGAGDEAPRHLTPQPVAGGHTFTALSAGQNSACALTTAGQAYCWGANYQGELGRDTLTDSCGGSQVPRCSSVPLAVSGGLRFTRISVGENNHVCALTAAGEAWCWGQNAHDQLATSAAPDRCALDLPCLRAPVRVETAAAFTEIVAGFNYTCALDAAGAAWCWGQGFGSRPAPVPGGLALTQIDAGARAVCGRTFIGEVYCWGSSLGTTPLLRSPVQSRVQSISVGEALIGGAGVRVCGIMIGGVGAECWSAGSSQS